ncbi:MAG TPA: GNAT family N-acetyltransferase [Burkholderiaceae bacterium]|nr:GNAT family N-acetyltransferase [Burkholderiaceae bacterium]
MATRIDAREIALLSRHAIEHGLPWSWTPRRVGARIEDRETNVVVASQRAQLLGFGIMSYADEDAHLQLLAVQIAHRRRGVASALVRWLEDSARVAGIAQVFLECRISNSGAVTFYRRHGYEEVRLLRGYYGEGTEDAVRMRKRLSAPEGLIPPRLPGPARS